MMPDGPGQASPDLAPAQREGTSAPVERFDPDRFRDELVEAEHLLRYMWAARAVSGRDANASGVSSSPVQRFDQRAMFAGLIFQSL